MTTEDKPPPRMHPKLAAERDLILGTFRLERGKIIRISTGKEPKLSLSGSGYLYVRAGSRKDGSRTLLRWHRVVFAVHHRELYELIDHRDGDRLNNDIGNLRPATRVQNAANSKHNNRPLPKSGVRNVYPTVSGKWEARWRGKHIGMFDTKAEAKAIVEALKRADLDEFYTLYSKVRTTPRIHTSAKTATAKRAHIAKAIRRHTHKGPPPRVSNEAASKAYFSKLRRANPLLVHATDEELRVIIDLIQP